MALLLYNLVFPLLFLAYLPAYLVKLNRRGGLTRQFWERLAIFGPAKRARLAALERPIWIHAVSVGEAVAACGFIHAWRRRRPDLPFVLSTTTTTGQALAAAKLPADVPTLYCPLDFWFTVRRALAIVNPRLLVIFEVEYWPNLIHQAARRGAGVALVNGRFSDRSARGYARHAWFFRPLFRHFRLFCLQSQADVERLERIAGGGLPAVACNTMKFDQVPDAAGADKSALFDQLFGPGQRLVWTGGSTHADEEALLADVFLALKNDFPELRLVLVPRHHERAAEVEKLLRERHVRYRLLTDATPVAEPVELLLVNTTGELMNFYGSSDIVYVGKSLAGCTGGHNIIEPAIFGKPIVHGPNLQNFRLVAELFRAAQGSLEVAGDADLLPAMRQLLADPTRRARLGQQARQVVEQSRGAIARTLDHLETTFPELARPEPDR